MKEALLDWMFSSTHTDVKMFTDTDYYYEIFLFNPADIDTDNRLTPVYQED